MEADWYLPLKKQSPLYLSYSPHSTNLSQNFVNPFLGYPICPIIGRYNRGQYRIGQTLFQLQFKCIYNHQKQKYQCGGKVFCIPKLMLDNLRNIPQVIANNKAAGIKNSPQVLPQSYPVREDLSIFWIISFGELGKDFLNYLNHMYVLAPYLFSEQKLKRQIHYLPIYAYLPQFSGLNQFEVQRGLNFQNYRGQYMSFHLSKGAPAFSPNNMRLSIFGGKIVTTKESQKHEKKEKPKKKYIDKKQYEQNQIIQKPQRKEKTNEQNSNCEKIITHQSKKQQQFVPDLSQLQNEFQRKQSEQKIEEQHIQVIVGNKNLQSLSINHKKSQKNIQKQSKQHQGFIQFYTSVLLEKDYRVYYHWHIQDRFKEDILKQIWTSCKSIQQLLNSYEKIIGTDPLVREASRLFNYQLG